MAEEEILGTQRPPPEDGLSPEVQRVLDDLNKELDAMMGGAAEGRAEERPRTPLVKEFVRDEQGRIVDIVFTQQGKEAKLKSVLPGSYEIVFDETAPDPEYKPDKDQVVINKSHYDGSSDKENMELLHEAGHAVNEAINGTVFKNLIMRLQIAQLKYDLARLALHIGPDKLAEAPASELLEMRLGVVLPQTDLAHYADNFMRSYQFLVDNPSEEKTKQYMQTQRERLVKLRTKYTHISERGAWVYAIKDGLFGLRGQGISLYTGTRQELFYQVNNSLLAHTIKFPIHVTDKYFITKFAK